MSGLRRRTASRALLICIAGGLVAGVVFWYVSMARQHAKGIEESQRSSVRAYGLSKGRRLGRTIAERKRNLSAERKIPQERLAALRMAGKLRAIEEADDGEGEVLTVSIPKGDREDQEVRNALVPVRDKDERAFLKALRTMMRSDDPGVRRNTLRTIGILYSGESAPAEPEEGDDAALSAEAKRIRGIVAVIRDGLCDTDADVREMAVKAARRIEGDASGVVASQVMSGDDANLKLMFLKETAGKATDADMIVSLMGLAAKEQTVRTAATENLKGLTDIQFKSYEEAVAWWDENHVEFLGRAAGIPVESNVAVATSPAEEDAEAEAGMQNLSSTDKEQTPKK